MKWFRLALWFRQVGGRVIKIDESAVEAKDSLEAAEEYASAIGLAGYAWKSNGSNEGNTVFIIRNETAE